MKLHGNSLILGTAAFVFLAAQPVFAQTTEITGVQLNPVDGGIKLVLNTSSGSRPQVFTTQRGKTLVADIINTQLRLSEGKSFKQDNPVPGISSVVINQLDANSIRVVVTGDAGAPNTQPVARGRDGITLSFTPGTTTAADPTQPVARNIPAPVAPIAETATPAQASGPIQPQNQAPPFLPRAIAPPVGDIAISNTDASPSTIDLGTQERVPRLVLKDAPVREVLSLLARAAGLNLAYTGASAGGQAGAQGGSAGGEGPTISLDIENEPVQDVFNYVLRLSGLEANRSNRTVFVGPKLPNSTRDVVMRSLRLNQVTVGVAVNFLVGLGAETAISRERQVTSVNAVPVGAGAAPVTQTQTTTESKVETQRIEFQDSNPMLRGLQALGDERTNSLTLIGPPRLVDIAMAQLGQLDLRRRQVAVNVKIIDINLLNTQNMSGSFSFGIGNNYFTNDNGAASLNFGGSRPATSAEVSGSLTDTPTIPNPYASSQPFLNANGTFTVPNGGSGLRVIQDGRVTQDIPGSATFLSPISPSANDPTSTGLSSFTPGTPDTVTITTDPTTGRQTSTYAAGTRATAEFSLASLYQFPKRFLSSLQAQVQSGNAKILTDPTLIVQEGQSANVNLTQEVVGNLKREITRGDGTSSETITAEKTSVGLTLAVKLDRVDDNGFVSLSVAPVVKAPQAPANINLGNGGSQEIFLVSERSLNSGLVRLRDGQTLILSGIIQDQDRTSVSKIPILGDIPLIGSLFRKTNRQNQRNEVIVLLTPQIMDDSERSSYGYNYQPSPEVRGVLERGGLKVPGKR
ncbi:MAG: AMIN domain-containing protein [Cyanomargarita calcarea GSE-NOS-MK-12-04C]|uniref:AMIN domain-containing protein n=1 Tax=Cyanomargarita calcarea GSE-NOS-MK-12-04C TaxID=2839659 RepID=A0A951QK38_9CYAN|nr:AMIN domain-containing protein [Cyanomargarita calcarea GSE-NOS-MK-12-04C]